MAEHQASYRVSRNGDKWAVNHDGRIEGDYETKEAAFEAIIGAASNLIKEGYGVLIDVPASKKGEPALGAK